MTEYRSYRIVDERSRWVVVHENGNIINKNPDKEELGNLEVYEKKPNERYTDRQLLNYLKKYYEEIGRIPTSRDLINNLKYPGTTTFLKRFGSWNNDAMIVKLDHINLEFHGILIQNVADVGLIILIQILGDIQHGSRADAIKKVVQNICARSVIHR